MKRINGSNESVVLCVYFVYLSCVIVYKMLFTGLTNGQLSKIYALRTDGARNQSVNICVFYFVWPQILRPLYIICLFCSRFYAPNAFLMDSELPSILKDLLQGKYIKSSFKYLNGFFLTCLKKKDL